MNFEKVWNENDVKIEQLATLRGILRQSYLKRNPNATFEQIENYIDRKLEKQTESILREQFRIIVSAINQ